jgi:RNA polymerase sigma-70 factor (sigma-E family)
VIADVAPRFRPEASTDAITTVFEAEYRRLCRLAFLLTGEAAQAEEIVMEAFVRSLARWRTVREPEAYVRRAVVNLCGNRRRRAFLERRRTEPAPGYAFPADPVDHVSAAVQALPPRQRAAVVLRYWHDLGDAEIADAMGCSTGTVKSQLAKARATLGRVLQEEA